MKVLVTGCNSHVCSCLVKQLSLRKDVVLLAVHPERLDISDEMTVDRYVSKFKP